MYTKIRQKIGLYNLKRAFRRLGGQINSLPPDLKAAGLIDFVFSEKAQLMSPFQLRTEIEGLIAFLEPLKPKNILEIGTANGGTLFLNTRIAHSDATVISIDLPGGMFGGGYPDWKTPFYKSFARGKQKMHLLRANAHDPATFEQVKNVLKGEKLDLLFIDGDHTYEGVKHDFELYSPLVKSGGLVVMHDIFYEGDPKNRVHVYWKEIKTEYKFKEFIANPEVAGDSGVSIGLGVLFV